MSVHIDRCICLGRSFADLREQAVREGLDLDGLMALPGQKGSRCDLCRPYLREALRTGQMVFCQVMVDPEAPAA